MEQVRRKISCGVKSMLGGPQLLSFRKAGFTWLDRVSPLQVKDPLQWRSIAVILGQLCLKSITVATHEL